MNLLTFQNRFANHSANDMEIGEVNGYVQCLADLMAYVQDKTEFNPSKRMLDAVDILNTIQETNAAAMEIAERASKNLINKMIGAKPAADPNDLAGVNI